MMVTVYGKSGFCAQCKGTEMALKSTGVEFEKIDLDTVPAERIEEWKATLGMQAPIVVTDTEAGSWSGFRPDKIAAMRAAA